MPRCGWTAAAADPFSTPPTERWRRRRSESASTYGSAATTATYWSAHFATYLRFYGPAHIAPLLNHKSGGQSSLDKEL